MSRGTDWLDARLVRVNAERAAKEAAYRGPLWAECARADQVVVTRARAHEDRARQDLEAELERAGRVELGGGWGIERIGGPDGSA